MAGRKYYNICCIALHLEEKKRREIYWLEKKKVDLDSFFLLHSAKHCMTNWVYQMFDVSSSNAQFQFAAYELQQKEKNWLAINLLRHQFIDDAILFPLELQKQIEDKKSSFQKEWKWNIFFFWMNFFLLIFRNLRGGKAKYLMHHCNGNRKIRKPKKEEIRYCFGEFVNTLFIFFQCVFYSSMLDLKKIGMQEKMLFFFHFIFIFYKLHFSFRLWANVHSQRLTSLLPKSFSKQTERNEKRHENIIWFICALCLCRNDFCITRQKRWICFVWIIKSI